MRSMIIAFLLLISIIVQAQSAKISCLIKTDAGDITIEVYPEQAPITTANFLKYVDQKLYDNTTFFRAVTLDNQPDNAVKIEVIQGGDVPPSKSFSPIEHETTQKTGILHKDGTVSMARGKPGSTTSSFFICINDQPELDFGGKRNPDGQGFAAFGKVTVGMDLVQKIQKMENKKQQLKTPVKILEIRRLPQ